MSERLLTQFLLMKDRLIIDNLEGRARENNNDNENEAEDDDKDKDKDNDADVDEKARCENNDAVIMVDTRGGG